ncbi:hypothetical protein STFE110948_01835 [Streptobacillus felis]|uniref:hypothetical protein n=1 Tax=Streptobacillus felis TaxID=1384509 RepID=UPI000833AC37|nr:hypothetical protein [Streptobacillus felis]
MNVLMYFMNEYSNFSFDDHIFIAGGNSRGKTLMYNFILSGLEGKEKENFLIDGSQVKKNQYVFLGISRDNTLDDEIKLTSKTYLMSRLETFREYVDSSKLRETVQEYFKSIEDLIKEEILTLDNFNLYFDFEKVNNSIFKAIEYKLGENEFSMLSTSEKMDLQIEMYINRLVNVNDNTFLIIDDFDTIYTRERFYEKLSWIFSKISSVNTKCIFFVKDENLVYELVNKGDKVMFIEKFKLVNLPNYTNYIDEIYLYSEEEIERKVNEIKKEKEFDIIRKLLK